MIDDSDFLSELDVRPSAGDGRSKEAAGISSVNWMQLCTSPSDDISSSAAGFGMEPRHCAGAKTPSTIYFRRGRPLLHNRPNWKNLTNTQAKRSELEISECLGLKKKKANGRFEMKSGEEARWRYNMPLLDLQ